MNTSSIDTSRTHASLLIRLRDPADQQAWEQFHERYAPMIRGWCRHWFPRELDDMVQEVLLLLAKRLRTFEYEPGRGRFRGYLEDRDPPANGRSEGETRAGSGVRR